MLAYNKRACTVISHILNCFSAQTHYINKVLSFWRKKTEKKRKTHFISVCVLFCFVLLKNVTDIFISHSHNMNNFECFVVIFTTSKIELQFPQNICTHILKVFTLFFLTNISIFSCNKSVDEH